MVDFERKIVHGPGGIVLSLDIDNDETPVMVYSHDGRHASTFDQAKTSGALDSFVSLTQSQMQWLNRYSSLAQEVFNLAKSAFFVGVTTEEKG